MPRSSPTSPGAGAQVAAREERAAEVEPDLDPVIEELAAANKAAVVARRAFQRSSTIAPTNLPFDDPKEAFKACFRGVAMTWREGILRTGVGDGRGKTRKGERVWESSEAGHAKALRTAAASLAESITICARMPASHCPRDVHRMRALPNLSLPIVNPLAPAVQVQPGPDAISGGVSDVPPSAHRRQR